MMAENLKFLQLSYVDIEYYSIDNATLKQLEVKEGVVSSPRSEVWRISIMEGPGNTN